MKTMFQDLKVVDTITKPLKIYCDNSTTIFFSKNDKYSRVAKHIKLKYFTIKEKVQKQRVPIEHVKTRLMTTNPLTKRLESKAFKEHVQRMDLGFHFE